MERDLLLRLHQHADQTLAEVRRSDPALAAAIEAVFAGQVERAVARIGASASPALRAQLVRLLATGGPFANGRALLEALRRAGPAELVVEAARRRHMLDILAERFGRGHTMRLGEDPALAGELGEARLHVLGDAAGLPAPKMEAVVRAASRSDAIDDGLLTGLVSTAALTDAEARSLGMTVSLQNILVDQPELAREARRQLGAAPLETTAAFDAATWRAVIERAGVRPPAGVTAEAYAESLAARAGAIYPTQALVGRLFPADLAARIEGLATASADDRVRFSNRYPGLDIQAVLDDPAVPDAHKAQQVSARIALLQQVQRRNSGKDLLALDYTPDSAHVRELDFGGMAPSDQRMVLSALKAYQRTWALARDPAVTTQLLEGGYSSATSIVNDGFTSFLRKSSLPPDLARGIYDTALDAMARVTGRVGTLLDVYKGGFQWLSVSNLGPDVDDYLKKIDGFAKLFGSQATCACEHCQSLLSPAAYFVDLMCFVDKHVTKTYFTGSHANHALRLKVRRPDLWTLELTCDNTDGEVPTLQIVDEVLENYIAKSRNFAGDFADRAAVEDEVYHLAILPGPIHSFAQPFVLPMTRLQIYIAYFASSRFKVADTVGAPPVVRAAARLAISQRELLLITQADAALASLRTLYGIPFQLLASGEVGLLDAHTLYEAMGLSRDDLGTLAATRFVAAGAPQLQIITEKKSPASVQEDVERVHHLTLDGLDRMHRLTRLKRCLTWTVGEIDLVLTQLQDATLGPAVAQAIVDLLAIQDQLPGTSVEELCALFGAIPQLPITDEGDALFDRVFNASFYQSSGGTLPQDATRFVHPSFRSNPPATTDTMLARLLGGLRTSDEDLLRLITALATPLGANLQSANEDERGFFLTVANLSLLYRHARLAERLSLSVAELFQLIGLAGVPGSFVATTPGLTGLLDFYAWWKSTSYTLDDLARATGGPVAVPEAYAAPEALAAEIIAGAGTDKSLLFADTIFAYFAGVSEAQSRAVIAANPTLFELAPDGTSYWLSSTFLPTSTLTIPAGTPLTASEAMALLLTHHASQVIPNRLAGTLSSSVDVVNALITMTGGDLSSGYTRVLQGLDPPTPLATLIAALLPLWVLFRDPTYDAKALAFVRAQAARFAIASFAAISMDAVRKLSVYTTFAKAGDPAFTDSVTPLNPADVQAVLSAFDAAQKWAGADAEQLARVLRAETGLVSTVSAAVALPSTAPEALQKLKDCVALCQILGVSGDFLALCLSEDYAQLQQAADAILAAFRARFGDEEQWNDQVEPYDDRLRERKRDALVDYLTRTIDPAFADADALYHYFLIDVQVAGCARTSRVVSAISSVQVYVNRVLMNLEQDNLVPSDPGHVAVSPDAIPADEWTWRQNYRVWEANRKVFLYPESYIEPELRDDKSPIFEDLESTVLQQDINDDTVLDAYASYLRAFDDVAALKIAGVWHDVRDQVQKDVLHLIGVALGNPPVYYYRNVQNLYYGERDGKTGVVWSPWTPIDVQITSDKASPVVYRGRLYIFWSDVKTRSVNVVKDGSSEFGGYQHTMSIKYTMQRLDGSWTPAQSLTLPSSPGGWPFGPSAGVVMDLLIDTGENQGSPEHAYPPEVHEEARDDYTLSGYDWEALYPQSFEDQEKPALGLVGRNHQMQGWVDFYKREIWTTGLHESGGGALDGMPILCAKVDPDSLAETLYYGHPVDWYENRSSYADMVLDNRRMAVFAYDYPPVPLDAGLYKTELAEMDEFDLLSVSSTTAGKDAILQRAAEVLLLRGSALEGAHWWISRIGTTLADRMAEKLSLDGVVELLATAYQLSLKEDALPISILTPIKDKSNAGKLDFTGPYGVYFREVFFHIPFLIANYLNSQGQYESAMEWYKYIFDPTAAEQTTPATDRNWRYSEFRGLQQPKLVDILTDEAALEVYRTDPFNPHAIARLRLSAYQKAIVMKYIDNLLDWADSLYTQFTTESINEATLLYVMAQDILGPRPVELGECRSGVSPKTYEQLSSLCNSGSEFLVDVETYQHSKKPQVGLASDTPLVLDKHTINLRVKANTPAPAPSKDPQAVKGIFLGQVWKDASSTQWKLKPKNGKSKLQPTQVKAKQTPIISDHGQLPSFGASLISQVNLAFCVPANKDLLAYWDRVEDRLFKIRNCMDIEGVKRQPALFAPEIDPRLLVRAKAAGLSLEDVISSIGGELPPYRFLYLIEKAKQYAGSLQGYGAALLGALEKKDGEELAQLRTVHQQNLLKLTTNVRQWEIDAASKAVDALQAQIETTTWRREKHKEYIDSGLTGWEVLQADSRYVATGVYLTESTTSLIAAAAGLIPQTGSPFALKWGGVELHNSFSRFAYGAEALGRMAEAISTAAGMVASFERRKQGWQFQYDLANKELASLNRQMEAAQKRLDVANRSMEIHEATIDQTEEIYEYFADKFSNLGLYTYLSTTLQRSFREAYNGAYAMARLCEQAYRFERGDDDAPLLEPSYWDSSHNGLLSGERLLIDLQAMERRFLETNYRTLEIDQSFSLLQMDPQALITLRETGTCDFWVPELFCDVFYPGHYRRKIRSARLTIPSVTGPYTNVSAVLTLLESKVRHEPTLGDASLVDVPPRRSVSIATSSAQNDAGVFELSFRDERYMPFEGAGCISHWQLSLPSNFRPFDYQSITDVILSLAYTASADGVLRQQVEAQNAAIEGTLLNVLSNQSLVRVFSLRQDFASAFSNLLHRPAGTNVPIEISDKFFPLFLSGRKLKVQHARMVLRTPAGQSVAGVAITMNGQAQSGFAPDAELGGLPSRDLGTLLAAGVLGTHTLSVSAAGALAVTSPTPGDVSVMDADKLNDLLLYVEYRVA